MAQRQAGVRATDTAGDKFMGATDDQLKALGKLTTEFQFLELAVQTVIWQLLDVAERHSGMILTSQLSFKRLCRAAEAIARDKMTSVTGAAEQIREIMVRISHLEEERNRLIHSLWITLPDDPSGLLSRIKITTKKELDIQLEPQISPDDLNEIADRMMRAAADLLAFLKVHGRYP